MKTGVIKANEVFAMPGSPLDAKFWLTSKPGESYDAWRERQARLKELQVLRRRALSDVKTLDGAIAALTEGEGHRTEPAGATSEEGGSA